MKEQMLYICEFCNTKFAKKEDAIACEKKHSIPKKIAMSKYHRAMCVEDGYPDQIEIIFENGIPIWYKRK